VSTDSALPLLHRLDRLHARVSDLVRQRAEDDNSPADPLRGLYLAPETALRWANRPLPDGSTGDPEDIYGAALEPTDDAGPDEPDRLSVLARRFGLSALDLHILLTALAADVDRRVEPLYAYLNDNVGRPRATVALALEIVGSGAYDRAARARFHAAAPLQRGGLLLVEDDPERPLPGRSLRVPERVIAHLLGDDTLDEALLAGVTEIAPNTEPPQPGSFTAWLARYLASTAAVVYLREQRPGAGAALAAAVLHQAGHAALRCDLPTPVGQTPGGPATAGQSAVDAAPGLDTFVHALVREARLRDAALVVTSLPARPAELLHHLEDAGVPAIVLDTRPFDPGWSPAAAVLALDLPAGDLAGAHTWTEELTASGYLDRVGAPDLLDPDDLAAAVAPFRIGRDQIRRAVRVAHTLAALDAAPLSTAHLQQAARQHSAPLLSQHTRQVQPDVGWDDLVLPDEPLRQLHELVLRARHRDRVLREWQMRPGGGRGHGVVALFAGDSGTGKTLSAEVLAGELGVTLYVVNLSSVVDKYIGETEKNLDRVFTEADRTDSVLLFDEADAIFGKRSEVNDSHDRYANLESAFLLQRLESFDGIAVLTTNLRSNIDEAFTRRLDIVIDFPFPDAALRAVLWRRFLAYAPCAPDLDLDVVGTRFELSGGAIRSAAVTAAYLAVGHGGPVSYDDIVSGAHREYQKMGHVVW